MEKVLFVFGELNDEDCEWLVQAGRRESLAAGQVMIQEGEPVDVVYIVLDGSLSVCAAALQGREIARLGAGEIVGEMSFLDSRPPSATVAALAESCVFAIPRALLADRLGAYAGFAGRFYRALGLLLSDRLRGTVRRLGYGDPAELDEAENDDDELDANVLNSVSLAGDRFVRMKQRVMAAQ